LVVVGQARMRPVATPDQALRRRLDERLRDLGGLWVGRRADLAVRIGARDLSAAIKGGQDPDVAALIRATLASDANRKSNKDIVRGRRDILRRNKDVLRRNMDIHSKHVCK